MLRRKVNMLMIWFSLVGGVIGFLIGEWLLRSYASSMPGIVWIGIYFAVVGFCIGLMCLLAELISPRLNGVSWKSQYSGASWKMLPIATLAALFVAGLLLELVYELDVGKAKAPQDIVMAIDVSGSMETTDPGNERIAAAKRLVDQIDADKRLAVIAFNHDTRVVQPFIRLSDAAAKEEVKRQIDGLDQVDGGTDIARALNAAAQEIGRLQDRRGTMVIMLSDGFSEVNLGSTLKMFQDDHIAVHTVGMAYDDPQGAGLLKDIAAQTGGKYYDVSNAKELTGVFHRIYTERDSRILIDERTGLAQHNAFYAVWRIFSLVCIGALIGLALGIIFDNRYLARSFAIGGTVAGLLAGLILEFGFAQQPGWGMMHRLLADCVLAVVISLFTCIVPIKDKGAVERSPYGNRMGLRAKSFAGADNNRSKGF
ncbi:MULTISPECIES: VWA domain-containing protein [unclassified Paenibacillus]|uniref:vWA domain-containing protein n=1 Tax=unclassified Paenibacillus TaxID=185978 RepID=UPI001C11E20E|nr:MULTISPECIES: vWA domain-containing protein [unclassified Paenibacillus]MBU5441405.1 VWA domain-containing protein [Paenibacillus sp. MSJ-34]CAH0118271.1 hypothetical protein PAE9249_00756 [Paenibacillus sp. CECT 9249]